MSRSYFQQGNLATRFLCYFGNTGDLFVDETLYPANMEQALHRLLTAGGYERIVFYGGKKGAYFLDEASRQLWSGKKKPVQHKSLFPGKQRLKLTAASAAQPQPQKGPLSYRVDAGEMLRYAEGFLRDQSIKTAVVFPNGVETLKEFAALEQGQLLDDFFVGVTQSSVDQLMNANVAVFVFHRSKDQVMDLLSGKAWESMNKYLLDQTIATHHQIPLPGTTEVRRMLNYLRLYGDGGRRLKLDCAGLDEISPMIARKIAANRAEMESQQPFDTGLLQAADLKGTMAYLTNQFIKTGRLLDLEACRRICRREGETRALDRLEALVGMDSVKEAVRGFLNLQRTMEKQEVPDSGCRLDRAEAVPENHRINLHFALTGSKGTGKTTVAKLLGEILCEYGFLPTGHTIRRTPAQLMGTHVGEGERNLIAAIQQAMGGVLFIDEAYELADPAASGIVTQLVADMDAYKGQFSVILAGYPDAMEKLMEQNEGLKGRFADNWIRIENYTPQELTEIFRRMARKEKLSLSPELEALLPTFLRNWYFDKRNVEWANARQMENLLGSMRKRCASGILDVSMIPKELEGYTTAQAEEDAIRELNSLIGLQSVKDEIGKLLRQSKYKNTPMPRHFIFSGNPGTGKTTVARLLGKILKNMGVLQNGHTVETKPDQLIADYVGGSTGKARAVFDSALDGVLFIDEAYGLVPTGRLGGKESDFGGAVINLLLEYTNSDSPKPMCVICAGYEEDMRSFLEFNKGLSRRFKKVIHFESYTVEELMQILELTLNKRGYRAEPAYLDAARRNFSENILEIGEKFNGGYVSSYVSDSEDRLFLRLEQTYGETEPPEEERTTLRAPDAP